MANGPNIFQMLLVIDIYLPETGDYEICPIFLSIVFVFVCLTVSRSLLKMLLDLYYILEEVCDSK